MSEPDTTSDAADLADAAAGGTGEPMIELRGVVKWFGSFQALHDIDLTSASGRWSSSSGRRARASRR